MGNGDRVGQPCMVAMDKNTYALFQSNALMSPPAIGPDHDAELFRVRTASGPGEV